MPPVKRPATVKLPVKMAVVSINFETYLLPAAKATKLLELMQEAVCVKREYTGSNGFEYKVCSEPEVELYMVKASQLRMPESESHAPRARGPFLLEG